MNHDIATFETSALSLDELDQVAGGGFKSWVKKAVHSANNGRLAVGHKFTQISEISVGRKGFSIQFGR